jgi:hypothetical protein
MYEFLLPPTCFIAGYVLCYFTMHRPIVRLKDEYIARLEARRH